MVTHVENCVVVPGTQVYEFLAVHVIGLFLTGASVLLFDCLSKHLVSVN